MTEAEIIEKLAQVNGVSEVSHVISTFKFYRKNKAGDALEMPQGVAYSLPGSASDEAGDDENPIS